MKCRIEIWRYSWIAETYESDNMKDIFNWYNENWRERHENGECAFDVYRNDELLSFEEYENLGFY